MLTVRSLCKSYPGGREVLQRVSFSLGRDETLAVIGPSGCGKTTLLYLLCGMARPTPCPGGAPDSPVLMEGRPVTRPLSEIAIILQDYGLLPWKTALKNAALGLKVKGVARGQRHAAAREMLARVGLAGRERDFPASLSGGEQQRVAIARAYVQKPKLLLMDEPFSSLDALTREKLQHTLLNLREAERIPYVLVTHSVEEAVFLGRRILILAGSPAEARAVFENPGFGKAGYRDAPEFYALVREIRKSMEHNW